MRSIVQDKTNLFFKILERDKNDWWQHWLFYVQTFQKVFEAYRKATGLTQEEEKRLVKSMNRPFLDRLKLTWEEKGAGIKERTVKILAEHYERLRSKHGNFMVFIMGLVGVEDVIPIQLDGESVFLVDIVSIFRKGHLEELPSVVLRNVEGVRSKGDR